MTAENRSGLRGVNRGAEAAAELEHRLTLLVADNALLRKRIEDVDDLLADVIADRDRLRAETAHLGRRLAAVHAVCDHAEKQARRSAPGWVAHIRTAAGGDSATVLTATAGEEAAS
ncbi:hypothetical protein ABZ953_06465 [Streptomyces sp. NPDC046465]|uniref:hypothetical protein n=1 Tax=Streptomyces sp. NPDC046465 TaxID=3155810 RepID=UPI0033F1E679